MKKQNKIETPEEIKKILKEINYPSSNKRNIYKRTKDDKGYSIAEHILIWEKHFGKKPIGSVIHHINLNKLDNRIENLMLFPSSVAHMNFHKQLRKSYSASGITKEEALKKIREELPTLKDNINKKQEDKK